MQLMTWPLARLGSRFGFLFEPQRRRVMHGGLGRFLDGPLDLAVGLIEADGTERVLPLTQTGKTLYAAEQFERINSITYRGYSEASGLCFELNLHSPFYPQDEKLCTVPAFYVELRVTWADHVRLCHFDDRQTSVKLFIRLQRDQTQVTASPGQIDLTYDVPLSPHYEAACGNADEFGSTDYISASSEVNSVTVNEQIISLNDGAVPMTGAANGQEDGTGLMLEMPVTAMGSGVKWRLIWGSYCGEPILEIDGEREPFQYTKHWANLAEVINWSREHRDDYLSLSRRFERLIEQVPIERSQWHVLVMAFQSHLSNTFWCRRGSSDDYFTVWEGNFMYHNTLDVTYNCSVWMLAMWPQLLRKILAQWIGQAQWDDSTQASIMPHDLGRGLVVDQQAYPEAMPVEENCNFLLLMQAYVHWTADQSLLSDAADQIASLARYLIETDTDGSGFPKIGTNNTVDDALPVIHDSSDQTYLAIKRISGLAAAADLLRYCDMAEQADQCSVTAAEAIPKIEEAAWLGDHYAVCVDMAAKSMCDAWTGQPLAVSDVKGWDDYSLFTSNGLMLPMLIAQPMAFDMDRIRMDMVNAYRETMSPYGCTHTSSDRTHLWISQNMWRDFAGRYLHVELGDLSARHWDMLVMSNTGEQSFGYIDSYVSNELAFNPRGVTAFGALLAGPRLVIDRLDGPFISVDPDRYCPSRWPLFPLADWAAGKIPICVVDARGEVSIEGDIEPVKICQHVAPDDEEMIG